MNGKHRFLRQFARGAAVGLALAVLSPLHARADANLVMDPTFLDGASLTGSPATPGAYWTITPGDSDTGQIVSGGAVNSIATATGEYVFGSCIGTNPQAGGTSCMSFGASTDFPDELSQGDLATTSGTTYQISFYVIAPTVADSGANSLQVMFDGTQVFDMNDFTTPDQMWTLETVTGVANSSASTIEFSGADDILFTDIADVSVQVAAAVPEPTSMALLGGALLLLAGANRRKRRS